MLGSFNLGLLPKEAFVAKVNAMKLTPTPLNANDVNWGVLAPVVGTPGRAQLTLTAKPEAAFTGAVTYTYDRLDVEEIFNVSKEDRVIHSIGLGVTTAGVHDVLQQISSFYGIAMQASDWTNSVLTEDSNFAGCYNFTLTPTASNILFYGSVDLKIWPKRQITALVENITESDGLYVPSFQTPNPQ